MRVEQQRWAHQKPRNNRALIANHVHQKSWNNQETKSVEGPLGGATAPDRQQEMVSNISLNR